MKTSEVLEKVIDLLHEPERWTKWAMARPMLDGGRLGVKNYELPASSGCPYTSPRAQSWCLSGAVALMTNDLLDDGIGSYRKVWRRLEGLALRRGFMGAVEFNNADDTTHEDLMSLLKEALYDAQADEARQAIKENDDAA